MFVMEQFDEHLKRVSVYKHDHPEPQDINELDKWQAAVSSMNQHFIKTLTNFLWLNEGIITKGELEANE